MHNLEQTRQAIADDGFELVQLRDRIDWYHAKIKYELQSLSGEKYDEMVRLIGSEKAAHSLKTSQLKQQLIDQGFLRPIHFVGYKSAC